VLSHAERKQVKHGKKSYPYGVGGKGGITTTGMKII